MPTSTRLWAPCRLRDREERPRWIFVMPASLQSARQMHFFPDAFTDA